MCARAFHARECSSLCGAKQAFVVLPREASPAQRSRAGSSCDVGRPSGTERARFRRRRQMQCFRAARSSNFERFGGTERVRAAILSAQVETSGIRAGSRAAVSSAPAEPSVLERPFRALQRSRAGSMSQTSAGAVFSSQAEPS